MPMTDLSAFWARHPSGCREWRGWLDAFDALGPNEGASRHLFCCASCSTWRGTCAAAPVLTRPTRTRCACRPAQFPGTSSWSSAFRRSCAWNRWCAPTRHAELGGHIASYASAADLFEVASTISPRRARRRPGVLPAALCPGGLWRRLPRRSVSAENLQLQKGDRRKGLCSYFAIPISCRSLAVPGPLDGPGTAECDLPGALHALSGTPRHPEKPRRAKVVGCRRRRNGRARVTRRASPLARWPRQTDLLSSTATSSGLDGRCAATLDRAELEGPSPAPRLERDQAAVGHRTWDPLFARDAVACCSSACTRRSTAIRPTRTDGRSTREHFFNKYPELGRSSST